MRKMLLSFKPDVYKRLVSGEKIYEHRKVFPNEPIEAYLYISAPVKAIAGIIHLNNRICISDWLEEYAYDAAAVDRISKYLKTSKYAMEISDFQDTTRISLEQLRLDLSRFVVPQMYYYIDDELHKYIQSRIEPIGDKIVHNFENITSNQICK